MKTTRTDTDLVRHIQEANVDANDGAWQQLYERYHGFVYRVASRHTHNHDDALDAVQETFIAAFQHIDRFRADAPLARWLKRIAENKCSDLRRRQRCRPATSLDALDNADQLAVQGLTAGEPHEPGSENDRQVVLQDLREAITGLTAPLRAVAALRYLQGLSYEEIGERLDLASGTIKSRLHRARLFLQSSGVVDRVAAHHGWVDYRRAG